jgi:hypothetical protein
MNLKGKVVRGPMCMQIGRTLHGLRLHVPDWDGKAASELVDLMQIVHLEPSVHADGAAVASRDVVEVCGQRVPVELSVAAKANLAITVKAAFGGCAVLVVLEHADLLQELPEVELRLVRAGAGALARVGVVVGRHRGRGHRLLQGLEAGHGRRQSRVGSNAAVGDGGAGRGGGRERRAELVGSNSRAALRRLGGRRAVLELLQPLVDDVDVVLRVEVEEAVCRDGGRGGTPGGGREPPEPLVRGGGGGDGGAEVRQVEEGVGPVEPARGLVVGERGLLGGGEGAEPEAGALVGLADLGHPLAPRPLAHAAVLARRVLRAALPPRRALLPRALPAAVALHRRRRRPRSASSDTILSCTNPTRAYQLPSVQRNQRQGNE